MLTVALILDALFGEPKWLWSRVSHPVVLMGKLIEMAEERLNTGSHRRAKGALLTGTLAFAAMGLGAAIADLPLGWLWQILIAAILIAQRSLVDHVRAVADWLRQSVPEGRHAVSMIVGRDTSAMDQTAVTRAAIESAAENFSDGVIAPALWFGVFGLPGILLYKVINTADSMIGHRNERFEEFGWAAAKLDDVLNWIPARATALLIAAAHLNRDAWRGAVAEAPRHRSPNAGWPEAALSRVLNTALSGPRSYGGLTEDHPYVHADGRHDLGPDDIDQATDALWRSWWVFTTIACLTGIVTFLAT